MSIRFTRKVRDILSHINTYGFITNKQCALIYYKGRKQPYLQAQTKLKLLYDNGVVKRIEYKLNKEYIYTLENKDIGDHRMYAMNLYALLYNKYKVHYFKLEESWSLCKKRNDAHFVVENDEGCQVGMLCEIDLYHKTSQKKLDMLYESGEVQEWYKTSYDIDDYYPSILIINNTGLTQLKSIQYDVVAVNFDFEGLESFL